MPRTLINSDLEGWIEKNPPVLNINATTGSLEGSDNTFAWDEVSSVYIVDDAGHLKGHVPISKVATEPPETKVSTILEGAHTTAHTKDTPVSIVYKAIKSDLDEMPVTDREGIFVGVVTARKLLSIMHDRHLEESLLMSGIRKHKGKHTILAPTAWIILKARLPWLLAGLALSLTLGFIVSKFQATLDASIALAFFMPVITYMAASVGTQSEAVTIHGLAVSKIQVGKHITKEILVGFGVGIIVAILGGVGAFVISQSIHIAIIVAGSLLAAVTAASLIGSSTPLILKALGKDPSVASGPLAAAVQDSVSLVVYFSLATLLLLS